MTKPCFNLFISCTYSGRKTSRWTHRRLKDKIRVYSLNVMKPEASASISLKSLAMFISDTPRAERSRAVNSSRVIRSSSSVSNSCRRERTDRRHVPLFICRLRDISNMARLGGGEKKLTVKWTLWNNFLVTLHQENIWPYGQQNGSMHSENSHTLLTWHYPNPWMLPLFFLLNVCHRMLCHNISQRAGLGDFI